MTALAGQQRPWTSPSPTGIACAIFSLPEAVVVVAMPAWSIRCINLKHSINHSKRILNDRIVRAADAITNQFKKTSVDNLFRGKLSARARRLICEYQRPVIGVLIRTVNCSAGIHADIMPAYA